jgi:dTDP-4-dehydrorhamnose 3,5-epimerase
LIEGLQIVPLRHIPDERGTVFHMLRRSDQHFREFGEIYFSSVYRGAIKGWHRHADMTLNYACIWGRVKLVILDDREGSTSQGLVEEVFLGPDNHSLVIIPPGLWNGFKGMADVSIMANCCTHEHDPSRSERVDPYVNDLGYDWSRRDC